MFRHLNVFSILIILIGGSCTKYKPFEPIDSTTSIMYVADQIATETETNNIRLLPSKMINNADKSIISNQILYIAESKKGLHVYDNVDPKNPKSIAFIALPALVDFAIIGTELVATVGNSLVSVNLKGIEALIVNSETLQEVASDPLLFGVQNRLPKVIDYPNYPNERNVYFQCPDSLGFVLSWKIDTTQTKTTCYR